MACGFQLIWRVFFNLIRMSWHLRWLVGTDTVSSVDCFSSAQLQLAVYLRALNPSPGSRKFRSLRRMTHSYSLHLTTLAVTEVISPDDWNVLPLHKNNSRKSALLLNAVFFFSISHTWAEYLLSARYHTRMAAYEGMVLSSRNWILVKETSKFIQSYNEY